MSDSAKTLEIISCPKTVADLWDELQKDIEPSGMMFKMLPNINYRFRFLGPFVTVNRLFIPYVISKYIKKDKLFDIMNGKQEAIDESMKKINSIVKPLSKEAKDAEYFFRKKIMVGGNFGQPCVMVNALIKNMPQLDFHLKVVPITSQMCNEFLSKGLNTKINGLRARDVMIVKQYPNQIPRQEQYRPPVPRWREDITIMSDNMDTPQVSMPQYTIDIMEESFVDQKQIDNIMRHGLYDIKKVIKDLNEAQQGNYLYREVSDYRMPKEFNDVILDGLAKKEEDKHISKAEEEFAEIPKDAFENVDRLRDPIGSLEID